MLTLCLRIERFCVCRVTRYAKCVQNHFDKYKYRHFFISFCNVLCSGDVTFENKITAGYVQCILCSNKLTKRLKNLQVNELQVACLGGAVGSVTVRAACMVTVIGESGFEARAGPIIVSGYSGVCFEFKFSGRHRGFDGVFFNL